MYQVDKLDRLIELNGIPQSCVGAPEPVVLSDEGTTILAFYLQKTGQRFPAENPTVDEPAAIVTFRPCYNFFFGAPNDEAMNGHPLYSRGLKAYSVFEVSNSSWVRYLEKMNSVHTMHDPKRFWERRHFIFTFHDSTFECVAKGFEIEKTSGSMGSIIPWMAEKLSR